MRLIEELREMAARRHKLQAELQELDATFEELRALVSGGVPLDAGSTTRAGRADGAEIQARRDRIVAVLGDRLMRAAEISRESGINATAVNSDLIALVNKGRIQKTPEGYRVGGVTSEGVRDAASPVPFSEPAAAGATN